MKLNLRNKLFYRCQEYKLGQLFVKKEEEKDENSTPGRATFIILLFFLLLIPAEMQIPPVGKICTHSTGEPWSIDRTLPWLRMSQTLSQWS